jgi:hypothetical protein
MPSDFPLCLYRGDTYRWQFALWQDAAKATPVDLTDATVTSEICAVMNGAVMATLACTVTLPNIVTIALAADESRKLTMVPARWDFQIVWPAGDVKSPVAGAVTVQLDATA